VSYPAQQQAREQLQQGRQVQLAQQQQAMQQEQQGPSWDASEFLHLPDPNLSPASNAVVLTCNHPVMARKVHHRLTLIKDAKYGGAAANTSSPLMTTPPLVAGLTSVHAAQPSAQQTNTMRQPKAVTQRAEAPKAAKPGQGPQQQQHHTQVQQDARQPEGRGRAPQQQQVQVQQDGRSNAGRGRATQQEQLEKPREKSREKSRGKSRGVSKRRHQHQQEQQQQVEETQHVPSDARGQSKRQHQHQQEQQQVEETQHVPSDAKGKSRRGHVQEPQQELHSNPGPARKSQQQRQQQQQQQQGNQQLHQQQGPRDARGHTGRVPHQQQQQQQQVEEPQQGPRDARPQARRGNQQQPQQELEPSLAHARAQSDHEEQHQQQQQEQGDQQQHADEEVDEEAQQQQSPQEEEGSDDEAAMWTFPELDIPDEGDQSFYRKYVACMSSSLGLYGDAHVSAIQLNDVGCTDMHSYALCLLCLQFPLTTMRPTTSKTVS
jgi:hypothetical protein